MSKLLIVPNLHVVGHVVFLKPLPNDFLGGGGVVG